MQYMLMFYETAADAASRGNDRAPAYWAGWSAYVGALHQSGLVVSGNGLEAPSMATTLRVRGEKRQVQDGPFADSKEQLGGYFIVEVPNIDVALEWAARAPCATTGGVEVRPVMAPPAAG